MTQQTIRAYGIAWYKREHYARCRKMFKDGHKLPPTFDKWQKSAKRIQDGFERDGFITERVYINPETFPSWCRSQSLNIDANARMKYASLTTARKYGQTH